MMPDFSKIDDYINKTVDEFELFDDYLPAEVCHYTKAEMAEIILKNQEILMNQLGKTNDPKESKWWNTPMLQWGTNDVSIVNFQSEVNRMKSEEWKVFCTTCHNNPPVIFLDQAPEFDHYRYGFSRSRMWAQYAEAHKGVCFLFDSKKLDANMHQQLNIGSEICHGFVKYDYNLSVREYPPILSEFEHYELAEGIRKSMIKFYDKNFLFKSPDWKAEHEFRWLVHNTRNLPELVSVEGAVKTVIFGVDFDKPSLIKLCKESGIPVRKMTWDKGRPCALKYG